MYRYRRIELNILLLICISLIVITHLYIFLPLSILVSKWSLLGISTNGCEFNCHPHVLTELGKSGFEINQNIYTNVSTLLSTTMTSTPRIAFYTDEHRRISHNIDTLWGLEKQQHHPHEHANGVEESSANTSQGPSRIEWCDGMRRCLVALELLGRRTCMYSHRVWFELFPIKRRSSVRRKLNNVW